MKEQWIFKGAWINGKLYYSDDNDPLVIKNPWNKEELGRVPSLTESEIHLAITSAVEAHVQWQHSSLLLRANLLERGALLIRQNKDELARVIVLEQGKPFLEAQAEVEYSAQYLSWFAGEANRVRGELIAESFSHRIEVLYEPVGVCALITSWNFPLAMLARKAGAALAAGCTVIAKPAPETPFSALAFAKILHEAGFPPSSFTVITGKAERIGKVLMERQEVRKLSFTGSTTTGKLLMSQAAATVKRVTLELGGNAPAIVFPDASLDDTVSQVLYAKFRNSGQTCISINRLFLHESIKERFLQKLLPEIAKLRGGNPFDSQTTLGVLTQPAQSDKIRKLIEEACEKGATLWYGDIPNGESNFLAPIVVTEVSDDMRIAQEEIFGPVLSVLTFREEQEVLFRANNVPSGLAAYVFSTDDSLLRRCSRQLEAGMVGLNETKISLVYAPFGGVKESGFGREGHHLGIHEYLTPKYCNTRLVID